MLVSLMVGFDLHSIHPPAKLADDYKQRKEQIMSPTNFHSIPLSRTTELRFEVSAYKGKNYINIRQYVTSDNYTGYTRKGVTLNSGLGEELLAALRSADPIQQPLTEQELCRLPKNDTTELVARVVPPSDKNKSASLDVREYVQSDSYSGWTQRGFRLSLDKLDQVIAYLAECLRQIGVDSGNADISNAERH